MIAHALAVLSVAFIAYGWHVVEDEIEGIGAMVLSIPFVLYLAGYGLWILLA